MPDTLLFSDIIQEDSDFPPTFKWDEFYALKQNLRDPHSGAGGFTERMVYCDRRLEKIGSGSSRIVYNIDDKWVLKLAKGEIGVEQNKAENDLINKKIGWRKRYFSTIEQVDRNFLYIVSEYCRMPTNDDFDKICGIFPFDNFAKLTNPDRYYRFREKQYEPLRNSLTPYGKKLLQAIEDVTTKYGVAKGDFSGIQQYGINKNNKIVIVDYGISDEIVTKFYS